MRFSHNEKSLNFSILIADNFFTRAGGLLFKSRLRDNEGLHIKPCNSIHTFGMKYSIDVVYLNKTGNILKVVHNMKPYRFNYCRTANSVLEFVEGTAAKFKLNVGDSILLKD
jgi:uncharacterized protein